MKVLLRRYIVLYAIFLGQRRQNSRNRIAAFSIKGKAVFPLLHWQQGLFWLHQTTATTKSEHLYPGLPHSLRVAFQHCAISDSWQVAPSPELTLMPASWLRVLLPFASSLASSSLTLMKMYPALLYCYFLCIFNIHYYGLQLHRAAFLTDQNDLPRYQLLIW